MPARTYLLPGVWDWRAMREEVKRHLDDINFAFPFRIKQVLFEFNPADPIKPRQDFPNSKAKYIHICIFVGGRKIGSSDKRHVSLVCLKISKKAAKIPELYNFQFIIININLQFS